MTKQNPVLLEGVLINDDILLLRNSYEENCEVFHEENDFDKAINLIVQFFDFECLAI